MPVLSPTDDTSLTFSPERASAGGSVALTVTAAAASPVVVTVTAAKMLADASVTSTAHSLAGRTPQKRAL